MTNDGPELSPEFYNESAHGGSRINRNPLFVVFGLFVIVAIGIVYTLLSRSSGGTTAPRPTYETALPSQVQVIPILAERPPVFIPEPEELSPVAPVEIEPVDSPPISVAGGLNSEDLFRRQLETQQRQEQLRLSQVRLAEYHAATTAETTVYSGNYASPGINNDRVGGSAGPPENAHSVDAGTVISGVLLTGINSELPGTIMGRITNDVYDSATGQYLLIPKGSRLLGRYSNSINLGQSRVMATWDQLILPNSQAIIFESPVSASDPAGYSGFEGEVDRRYWGSVGNALLLSVFSAGIQLSQPQAQAGQNITNQQVVAAATGQQLGQLGQETARQGLSLGPVIKIEPGYAFSVLLSESLQLSKYKF